MTYQPYYSEPHPLYGGSVERFRFEGMSHGASVIHHPSSKGIELAVVFYRSDGDWWLCYCTPISSDVMGDLSASRVQSILAEIDKLGDRDCRCEGPGVRRWED